MCLCGLAIITIRYCVDCRVGSRGSVLLWWWCRPDRIVVSVRVDQEIAVFALPLMCEL